jgi:hypothetical protein
MSRTTKPGRPLRFPRFPTSHTSIIHEIMAAGQKLITNCPSVYARDRKSLLHLGAGRRAHQVQEGIMTMPEGDDIGLLPDFLFPDEHQDNDTCRRTPSGLIWDMPVRDYGQWRYSRLIGSLIYHTDRLELRSARTTCWILITPVLAWAKRRLRIPGSCIMSTVLPPVSSASLPLLYVLQAPNCQVTTC